jgi:hypothetical protein
MLDTTESTGGDGPRGVTKEGQGDAVSAATGTADNGLTDYDL